MAEIDEGRLPGPFWDRLNELRDAWHDRGLSALLLVQAVVIFVLSPARAEGVPLPEGVVVVTLLALMSLVIIMARGRWTLAVGIGTFVLNLASLAATETWHGPVSEIGGDTESLITFGVLGTVVLQAVFREGPYTHHRVRGAIVFYLNLGLFFAILHRLVADLIPGAYTHLPPHHDAAAYRAATNYLSFVTLTSLGYGDIVPVDPVARAICTLEATVGQLLPTVLIARVVVLAMREADEDLDP